MNLRDAGQGIPNIAPATVQCDLCSWPMALPTHCKEQGAILGLLVCTACIEDQLEALSHERSCH